MWKLIGFMHMLLMWISLHSHIVPSLDVLQGGMGAFFFFFTQWITSLKISLGKDVGIYYSFFSELETTEFIQNQRPSWPLNLTRNSFGSTPRQQKMINKTLSCRLHNQSSCSFVFDMWSQKHTEHLQWYCSMSTQCSHLVK